MGDDLFKCQQVVSLNGELIWQFGVSGHQKSQRFQAVKFQYFQNSFGEPSVSRDIPM